MLYTVSEVAKMLKVNRNFVYNLIKNGELEAVRIGSIKVKQEALNRYVEKHVIRGWTKVIHKINNRRRYYESDIDCFVKITTDTFEFNVVSSELLNGFSRCDVFIDRTNNSIIFKLNNDGEYAIVTHKGRRNKYFLLSFFSFGFLGALISTLIQLF